MTLISFVHFQGGIPRPRLATLSADCPFDAEAKFSLGVCTCILIIRDSGVAYLRRDQ